jgi:hypothetical protein
MKVIAELSAAREIMTTGIPVPDACVSVAVGRNLNPDPAVIVTVAPGAGLALDRVPGKLGTAAEVSVAALTRVKTGPVGAPGMVTFVTDTVLLALGPMTNRSDRLSDATPRLRSPALPTLGTLLPGWNRQPAGAVTVMVSPAAATVLSIVVVGAAPEVSTVVPLVSLNAPSVGAPRIDRLVTCTLPLPLGPTMMES